VILPEISLELRLTFDDLYELGFDFVTNTSRLITPSLGLADIGFGYAGGPIALLKVRSHCSHSDDSVQEPHPEGA
jgi:hypothetical protein